MSTRSEIAVQKTDGSIASIYCHGDGYLEHNGVILNKHYASYDKALSIIEQNDCSSLGETIEESRFYNTWSGEDTESKKFDNEHHFMKKFGNNIFAEYIYLFKIAERTADDDWYVSELKFIDNPSDNYNHSLAYHTKFFLLSDALKKINERAA
tara:strand:+ start:51 stop:509 length:459 start_codon:yes stop_codon:yes gene_type:complete